MKTGASVSEMRKVTVTLPASLLERAKDSPEEGVTETIRRGLQELANRNAQRKLLQFIGKVDLGLTVEDIAEGRRDRDSD
jgi:hypothetical protein